MLLELHAYGSRFNVKLETSKPIIVLTSFDAVAKSMLLRFIASLAKHDVSAAERMFCKAEGDKADMVISVNNVKCEVRLECSIDAAGLIGSSCVESILVPAARAAMQLMTEPDYRTAAAKITRHLIGAIARLKISVDDDVFVDVLAEYRRMINDAVEEINRVSAKHGIRVRPEDLDPLSIIIDDNYDVIVMDRRSGARLEPVLPSVIAAAMVLRLLLYAAARASRGPMLIAIEEPETGATPAQQLVFARLAARLVEISWRRGRPVLLVLETHSPYIAYGLADAAVVYHVYRDSDGRINVSTETPFAEYAIAEVLWMNMRKTTS